MAEIVLGGDVRVETIGNATLYLGDCLEILPTLAPVDSVITDPPYGVALSPQRGRTQAIQGDGAEEARLLWSRFMPLVEALAKDDTAHLFWTSWKEIWTRDCVATWFNVKSCVVWVKNVFGIGYYTRPQHEMAWYAHKGKPPTPAKADSDLWFVPRVHRPAHSCEKPVALLERAVRLCTYGEGQTVLDPFMGIGSTGVASVRLGRKFVGIEIEPRYFDIACERIAAAQSQGRLFA